MDVEEWYHNCWVPEYVDPGLRPNLPEELDRLLPQLAEEFDRTGARGDLRSVYVTMSASGRLGRLAWPVAGHRLHFNQVV